jgi:hypothetical protein
VKGSVWQVLYLFYCVEAGLFLTLAPWSLLWIHGYYAQVPVLRPILMSGYLRGGVSALGLLMLLAGAADLIRFCRRYRDG